MDAKSRLAWEQQASTASTVGGACGQLESAQPFTPVHRTGHSSKLTVVIKMIRDFIPTSYSHGSATAIAARPSDGSPAGSERFPAV